VKVKNSRNPFENAKEILLVNSIFDLKMKLENLLRSSVKELLK